MELAGMTVLIVGLGHIGNRLAKALKALDAHVIGVRRTRVDERGHANEVVSFDALRSRLGQADLVVLTCPLTAETTNLVDATVLALMKPGAWLVNVAWGACVDEAALIATLEGARSGVRRSTACRRSPWRLTSRRGRCPTSF